MLCDNPDQDDLRLDVIDLDNERVLGCLHLLLSSVLDQEGLCLQVTFKERNVQRKVMKKRKLLMITYVQEQGLALQRKQEQEEEQEPATIRLGVVVRYLDHSQAVLRSRCLSHPLLLPSNCCFISFFSFVSGFFVFHFFVLLRGRRHAVSLDRLRGKSEDKEEKVDQIKKKHLMEKASLPQSMKLRRLDRSKNIDEGEPIQVNGVNKSQEHNRLDPDLENKDVLLSNGVTPQSSLSNGLLESSFDSTCVVENHLLYNGVTKTLTKSKSVTEAGLTSNGQIKELDTKSEECNLSNDKRKYKWEGVRSRRSTEPLKDVLGGGGGSLLTKSLWEWESRSSHGSQHAGVRSTSSVGGGGAAILGEGNMNSLPR